jgi:lantibiotic modifying enzyme
VLYAAGHLHRLWRRPELLDQADRITARLEALLDEDAAYDVIGGAAGCLLVLLAFARATGRPEAHRLAKKCGEHLLRHARPVGEGLAWTPRSNGRPPLSGVSHGGAGFAWALLELAAATGDPRFREAALGALAHERTLFVPERSNWRDLRSFHGPGGGFGMAWCNGAPGIGLSRLAVLERLEDPAEREVVRGEIGHALAITWREGFGPSQCLCHGSLGNLELLTEAARRLGEERWLEPAGQVAAAICEEVRAGRFNCGVPGGFETPGLMDGLAGIGYGLLRLADPERVPSVLLLE